MVVSEIFLWYPVKLSREPGLDFCLSQSLHSCVPVQAGSGMQQWPLAFGPPQLLSTELEAPFSITSPPSASRVG